MKHSTTDLADSPLICARFLYRPGTDTAATNTDKQFSLDIDLQIPGSGVTGIFGHSGSGKTTLLRCIAGLEKAPAGKLLINGDVWQDGTYFKPVHQRAIGYVFQEASLFPHLDVLGNLRYAIKRANKSVSSQQTLQHSTEQTIANAASMSFDHIVHLLGIENLLGQATPSLSGGERQRVAIARALLIQPRLLLMDEPLASLDNARKQEIIPYLEKLRSELAIPILYVSHSPEEMARLANHIVALEKGKTVAQGSIGETLSSINFPLQLGEDTGVVWEGTITELDQQWHLARITIANTHLWVRNEDFVVGQTARLRIFANDVSLSLEKHTDTSIVNVLAGKVIHIVQKEFGAALVQLSVSDEKLLCSITLRSVEHLQLQVGKNVWVQIKSVAVVR